MQLYWIYTGETQQEAETKANTELAKVNAKWVEIVGEGAWADLQQLTANPEINGNVYYYGFAIPPTMFVNGAVCDLEIEYSSDWFIHEEI